MIKSFFSLLLIALLFASSIGVTVHRVKDPEFLGEQIRSANMYGRLSETLPKLIDDKMLEGTGFSKEDLATVITGSVDSAIFYDFADTAASAYLPWLTGETTELSFRYDLATLKANIRDRSVDRMLAKYAELPICNAGQIKSWSTENGLPSCQLPATNVRSNDVARLFGEQIDTVTTKIPAELVGKETAKLAETRMRVSTILRGIQLTWVITFIAFFLFLALLRRNAFLSLAFIFLLTGLIEAVFGLIAWDWVGKLVIDSMPSQAGAVLPVMIDVATTGLDVLKHALASFSVVLIIVGAAFLFFWIFFRPKAKRPLPVSA
jgi:hypothetical protein